VVVNNALSIPFDDAGDASHDDDAVVAAAAAASGYVLVMIDEDELGATIPDYDPTGGEVEEGGESAQYYQNVDNTPWDGVVLQGPHDYENAPGTTMTVVKGRNVHTSSNHRTASTSSNTLKRYENVPTLRKTVRRGRNDLPSTDVELESYEVVEVQKIPQPEPEGCESMEARKTRKHKPNCKCGGRSCKLEHVWWCTICGSEAAATFTLADAEACELNHRTLQMSILRRPAEDMEMYTEAAEDEAVGDGGGGGGDVGADADADAGNSDGAVHDGEPRMYSEPNGAMQTYAAVVDDDAPQMYSAPTDVGEAYDGIQPVNGEARMYSQPIEVGQVYTGATDV
jgi:hypothetical protein